MLMMVFLYNFGIKLYSIAIRLAAIFGHPKAKLWIEGRQHVFDDLRKKISENDRIIWFHAASLGEFEQGRPLIEKIKSTHPQYRILLTFYSPSGYEIRKNYPHADIISYLPLDTRRNAVQFLEIVKPSLVVFIKYEFWYHFLNQATLRGIRVIYIAALFRPEMLYFSSYFNPFKPVFRKISHYFVQNSFSKNTLLEKVSCIDPENISIAGDPRIDRVIEIAAASKEIPLMEEFCSDKKILVAGSTWEKDIEILKNMQDLSEWKLVIAPHELKEKYLSNIENHWNSATCVRYSKANSENCKLASVMIIDNIGMLSSLYKYARIAYIGGGFGGGIHNKLEPMAFGIPVIFGPKYKRFEEACRMVEQEGAFSVKNWEEFEQIFNKLSDLELYHKATEVVKNYMIKSRGATTEILKYCSTVL